MMAEDVYRGDVYLVSLNPARGGEIQKTRPCVIVSPDELNAYLRTFIVAPLTTGSHTYPFRVPCHSKGVQAMSYLDQIRAVDQGRLVRRLGKLSSSTLRQALAILQEMFAL